MSNPSQDEGGDMSMQCLQCGSKRMVREEPFLLRLFAAQSHPSQLAFMALALGVINYFLYGGLGFLDLAAISLALVVVWVCGQVSRRKLRNNQHGWKCKDCGGVLKR